jgi:hypothetical protein
MFFTFNVGIGAGPPVEVTPDPAGPSAPTVTFSAGEIDGEGLLDVTALPADWGDDAELGDGLGTIGSLEYQIGEGPWYVLDASAEVSLYPIYADVAYWALETTVRVRGRNAEGRAGTAAEDTITFPGTLHVAEAVTVDGVTVTHNGEAVYCLVPSE